MSATSDLDARALAAALRKGLGVIERGDPLTYLSNGERLVIVDVLREKLDALTAPIVFRPLSRRFGEETWLIHRAGETPRSYPCELVGLTVAWLAIHDRGRSSTVRAADFTAPWASQSDTVVRKAVKTAADWVERHTDCRVLAAVMRQISVSKGVIRLAPTPEHPEFDTGD